MRRLVILLAVSNVVLACGVFAAVVYPLIYPLTVVLLDHVTVWLSRGYFRLLFW